MNKSITTPVLYLSIAPFNDLPLLFQILRDIRHGLSREASLGAQLRGDGNGGGGGAGSDDTYMYDDDMIRLATLGHHWYDEPPYESDPEDFLMVAADQHNQRYLLSGIILIEPLKRTIKSTILILNQLILIPIILIMISLQVTLTSV